MRELNLNSFNLDLMILILMQDSQGAQPEDILKKLSSLTSILARLFPDFKNADYVNISKLIQVIISLENLISFSSNIYREQLLQHFITQIILINFYLLILEQSLCGYPPPSEQTVFQVNLFRFIKFLMRCGREFSISSERKFREKCLTNKLPDSLERVAGLPITAFLLVALSRGLSSRPSAVIYFSSS